MAKKCTTFHVCDAQSPEAMRRTADNNDLPLDRLMRVSVPDPEFSE